MATTAQPIHSQSMDDLRALSIEEFTVRLGLKSHWTVRRWISQGKVQSRMVGGRRIIPLSELKRALEVGL